ncbi:MAG: hypothetical protein HYY06_18615 [Deltaproteobacteria bacterium]|nr:hypothetical protein [Deltaproteobacteria bacterium]
MGRVLAFAVLLWGCENCPEPERAEPPRPSDFDGVLEIGVNGGDEFVPLHDGDDMNVSTGSNGLDMVVPCLRATDVDPTAPIADITVTIDGVVRGAELPGQRADMQSDGAGWVLWDLRVPFQVDGCCVICSEAVVNAILRDDQDRELAGSVRVVLQRGAGCPDPEAECADPSTCPSDGCG